MPEIATLVVCATAVLALVAVPGPNILYIAMPQPRAARGPGLLAGGGDRYVAAALGLSALLASSAVAFNLVKYGGAAYLKRLTPAGLLGSALLLAAVVVLARHAREG